MLSLRQVLTLLWEVSHLSSLMRNKKTQQYIWGGLHQKSWRWHIEHQKHCSNCFMNKPSSFQESYIPFHFSLSLKSICLGLVLKGEWMTFHWELIFFMHPHPSTGWDIILHLIRPDIVQSASSIALVSPSSPSRCLPMFHSFPLALRSLHLAIPDCSTPTPSVRQSASSVFQPAESSVSGLRWRLTWLLLLPLRALPLNSCL